MAAAMAVLQPMDASARPTACPAALLAIPERGPWRAGCSAGWVAGLAGGSRHRGDRIGTGVVVGGFLGGAVGCWTAHEQAVAAAREDRLNARADDLERQIAELHAYNDELAQKADTLRHELAEARATEGRMAAQDDTYRQLQSEQAHAREQLGNVDLALTHVEGMLDHLDREDPKYGQFSRERDELLAARDKLQTIVELAV
ncbi:MAG: hypothetical protein WDN03_02275 [Rhizomicrobium sp.]